MPTTLPSEAITWVLEVALPDDQRPALEALMHEMTEATLANEPGCLLYDWFITADGTGCHILESYADDAALLAHINTFNTTYARHMFSIVSPRRLTVYGAPSISARAALAPLHPVYLSRL
ncbi:Antibiotic biosynthesis monooxygenase [Thalassovita gelatinovora]|uniref:Antibiotic biosynthesis monooxygenase n=1 Tax=Thalassovita gelatinovora TaxID=53501 RepID=A0A0N7LUC2_THAGE|nr:antibiotic biosynthesis monooxygenase [Thalassovita gelatinovora]QIZ79591.1 antibiotic biosynthesis monooxygenase [Thalassovita gelatinovora]CUH63090.1 Antibiotic biosynthesis monooxygenase [Thalassovita gelatinovora]SEQ15574.1 Antibiotic biosynthesis monooxygenase [Thalassovita gelatinovora]